MRNGSARRGTVLCFALETLSKNYDLNTPEGKTDFLKEAARRLGTFEEELERNNYIEAVAKEYQVDMGSLKKLVSKTAIQDGLARPAEQTKIYTADRKAERARTEEISGRTSDLDDREQEAVWDYQKVHKSGRFYRQSCIGRLRIFYISSMRKARSIPPESSVILQKKRNISRWPRCSIQEYRN